MIDCLYDALNEITWPDLKDDTVLNIWAMRTAPQVSEHSLKCDWPLLKCHAQGDSAAETPLTARANQNKIRKCIPSDISGVSFRVKLLAGGLLENINSIFHVDTYCWKQSHP
jgi:hypothetical protein